MRKLLEEYGIEVKEWPALSPDLNPIENLWRRLKEMRHPVLRDLPASLQTILPWIRQAFLDCWPQIDKGFVEKLWKSMPSRVEALLQADGWFTKY